MHGALLWKMATIGFSGVEREIEEFREKECEVACFNIPPAGDGRVG